MQLEGSSAIVTGATSGIGGSVASRLADRGVKVYACGRRVDRLESLADLHDGVIPVELDVRREDDRARLVDMAGPVDHLVN